MMLSEMMDKRARSNRRWFFASLILVLIMVALLIFMIFKGEADSILFGFFSVGFSCFAAAMFKVSERSDRRAANTYREIGL